MLPNSRLRALDGVCNAMEAAKPRIRVELEPRCVRVAVARLPDRAGIEQPAAVELHLGSRRSETAAQLPVVETDPQRDVAVPDEHERRVCREQARVRRLRTQHVLPDRVARARVEQLDVTDDCARLELAEERA